ncbi:hypothetical protein [Methanolapillus ohkumae]|uniref:Uncharacterized protein n=1 Tax=Methanolapillus ohkumae TaxID=3028298 RepID=A0AA96V6A6_9EURY|nr:hypothetical protein MsAm2_12710 [Methanosarcinaceae archaeon Am2]
MAEKIRKQRLGEGALGVSLWKWQASEADEIYVTIFEKHQELIHLFERFGFKLAGQNLRGEQVYLRSKKQIDYSDPFKSFPFICPKFEKAGMIPIEDGFHDSLFPYSELKGNKTEIEEETAGNGVLKVFIASPISSLHYNIGEPVIIYRKYTGKDRPSFKSAATSFCTIANLTLVKKSGKTVMSLEGFIKLAGNKTIFKEEGLRKLYHEKKNLILIEILYNGYFGKGHNVNYIRLKEAGLFEGYPYQIQYSPAEFIKILEMGDVCVQDVIIDSSGTCGKYHERTEAI